MSDLQTALELAQEIVSSGVPLDRYMCDDPDDVWGELFELAQATLSLYEQLLTLKDQTRWRRVEEELPPKWKHGRSITVEVLCIKDCMHKKSMDLVKTGMGVVVYPEKEFRQINGIKLWKITHWRYRGPLPEPPEPTDD
jgi:hypothetical protein